MLGNPAAVARVEHAQAALSTEVQGLRELMASLRPPTLDEVGLEAALSATRRRVRPPLRGRLLYPRPPRRPPRRRAGDGRLRVAQEALLNVARHAEAGHLWLQLDGAGDRLDLEIRDGVGFEPVTSSTLVRDGRFGLVAMQERVEMAGAASSSTSARRRRHRKGNVPGLPAA